MDEYYIKYQTSNLCMAFHFNITDNVLSISFDIYDDEDVQVMIKVRQLLEYENEYFDDAAAEFSALQHKNIGKKFIVTDDVNKPDLQYLFYSRSQK